MPDNKNSMSARDRAIKDLQMRKLQKAKRQKRKSFYKYASSVFVMALFVSMLFFIIMGTSLAVNFSSCPQKYKYSLEVFYNGEKTALSTKEETNDNVCYVSLNAISELLGASLAGDVREMSCVFPDKSYVSYIVDSSFYSANGTVCQSKAPSYFKKGDVYVPIETLYGMFDTVELSGVQDKRKIDYSLKITEGFKMCFSNNNPAQIPKIPVSEVMPQNKFISNLDEYEKYMNPEETQEYIRLINTSHTLSEDYVPEDLTEISNTRNDNRPVQKMRLYAAKALDAMFIEMKAAGFTDVSVTSAYRDYSYQKQLFDNKLNYFLSFYDYNTAYEKTATQNAIPGTSEHQSGLCADLHNLPSASVAFEAQPAYDWLVTHCADFGFILRYPKNKTHITGIMYEPWHYRYVGRYHAQKIMQSGLCLEEYCELNGIGY